MLLLTRFKKNNKQNQTKCMWNYGFDIEVILSMWSMGYLRGKLGQAMVLDVWHAHTIKCQANDLRGLQQSIICTQHYKEKTPRTKINANKLRIWKFSRWICVVQCQGHIQFVHLFSDLVQNWKERRFESEIFEWSSKDSHRNM